MRFDDSLDTVLSAEMSTPFGAQSTWRQLVDLIGRGRVGASAPAIARLRTLRSDVPPPVRAASVRSLAFASPPAALVGFLAEDELAVAAPVLRTAQLSSAEWIALLPALTPAARSVLRHRRDLAPAVTRALESFGSVDFVLAAPEASALAPFLARAAKEAPFPSTETQILAEPDAVAIDAAPPESTTETSATEAVSAQPAADALPVEQAEETGDAVLPDAAAALSVDWTEVVAGSAEPTASLTEPMLDHPETIVSVSPFVSIAAAAAGLPVVAEARRQAELAEAAAAPVALTPVSASPRPEGGTFPISELVARIDAYQRQREEAPAAPALEIQPELFAHQPRQADSFRFETDAAGVVRWIEGAARAPLIGLTLDHSAALRGSQVDGVAAGAFRRRAGFANARLVVEGHSDAAGPWRITGIPVFDRASGRFTGYRGSARRPRADETAEPVRETRNPAADALRQLVHELRTPTNAIAGFAEMIEAQMLGPVPAAYRAHAAAIRSQTGGLLTAIDDLDMAARIETHALDLRTGDVPLAPLLARVMADLTPLATLRGTQLDPSFGDDGLAILGDDRAVERLIARLLATLVASGGVSERIGVRATLDDDAVSIVFDRPRALAAYAEETLLTIDAESEAERADENGGAPLLGTGFALRLARNLAAELRGSLVIGDKVLTLRLPAAFPAVMEQVSTN